MKPETREEVAKRLIAEAEGLVARQKELVVAIAKNGRGVAGAVAVLDQFEATLKTFRQSLALLQSTPPIPSKLEQAATYRLRACRFMMQAEGAISPEEARALSENALQWAGRAEALEHEALVSRRFDGRAAM